MLIESRHVVRQSFRQTRTRLMQNSIVKKRVPLSVGLQKLPISVLIFKQSLSTKLHQLMRSSSKNLLMLMAGARKENLSSVFLVDSSVS